MAGQQDHAPVLRAAADGRGTPLRRSFFDRDPLVVAPELLGTVLEHRSGRIRVAVRLTEVEAYLGEGEDPASHSYRGRRPRNAVMFGPPGHAYLYFTYGMHWCANVVCRPDGVSGAVLIRAGEVISGLELARSRRPTSRKDVDLARGPARLASALALTGADNGRDLCAPDSGDGSQSDGGELRLLAGDLVPSSRLRCGPRVGVAGAGAASPWRWWLADEPTVSSYRPAAQRRRPKPGGDRP